MLRYYATGHAVSVLGTVAQFAGDRPTRHRKPSPWSKSEHPRRGNDASSDPAAWSFRVPTATRHPRRSTVLCGHGEVREDGCMAVGGA